MGIPKKKYHKQQAITQYLEFRVTVSGGGNFFKYRSAYQCYVNKKRVLPVELCTRRRRWEISIRLLVLSSASWKVWRSALMDFLPLSLYSSSFTPAHSTSRFHLGRKL